MVNKPEDYPWSSYTAYISDTTNPHVTTEKTLSYFKEPRKLMYRSFVEETASPLASE